MLTENQTISLCNKHKVCIVIPTYNNETTLAGIVLQAKTFCNNVIVVNDGSTDSTDGIISEIDHIIPINYSKNKGKGHALKTGFAKAWELGFQYAVTIDSDGQHNPSDIPKFLKKLDSEGEAMIIGVRNMDQPGVPGKSNFGRKFSNFWFWVETGSKHDDTQSGFRLYPLKPLLSMNLITPKFEFEIESIIRLAWKGIQVTSVDVSVVYFPAATRISHFRPFRDFTRISILNTVLVFMALLWFRPMLYLKQLKKNGIKYLISENNSPFTLAASVAFGVFMGIIPIWGFQLVTAIALAVLLKLNKPLVILFANISIPPFIPVIIYLSMVCGSFWVDEGVDSLIFSSNISIESVKPFFMQYITGAITLAFLAAFIFGMVTFVFLKTKK